MGGAERGGRGDWFDRGPPLPAGGGPPFCERGAERFEDAADFLSVGGDAEADAQPRRLRGAAKVIEVTENQGTTGLDNKDARGAPDDGLQNSRHKALFRFGGLIRIG